MIVAAALVALLAAFLFAVVSVAQQKAASAVPDRSAKGIHLILHLIRRPLWWAGFAGDTGGYICQAIALGLGSLLLVQPLLVAALLFALPMGAAWGGRRLRGPDWVWAIVLTVSLAVFVVAGNPTSGMDRAGVAPWLGAAAIIGPVLAVCLVWAALSRGTTRAVTLAIATGVLYGATAALTKSVISLFGKGLVAVVVNWETYALIVAATAGTILQQSAYQAGNLEASLPAVTVLEPVVAAAIGVTILREHIQASGPGWILIAFSILAMIAGTVALSRSSARVEPAPTGRR